MTRAAFLDEAVIEVAGGQGGSGSASFQRTRRQPRGGPDGGNGGQGGSVYARAELSLNSLYDYVAKRRFVAVPGGRGSSNKKHGANGADLCIKVPVGTDIFDDVTGARHASLLAAEEQVLLAAGGSGGRGNVTFKSSTNRTPRQFTPGQDGDLRQYLLVLRLLADIGLVGLPNAGKSMFLNAIANTEVATAAYPFTTMKPQLGVVELEDYSQLTVADLPGIIHGAAAGVGLGLRFLRHVTRTRLLLHMVDAGTGVVENIVAHHNVLLEEMHNMDDAALLTKPRKLILTKIDLLPQHSISGLIMQVATQTKTPDVMAISSKTGAGVGKLVRTVAQMVKNKESSYVP